MFSPLSAVWGAAILNYALEADKGQAYSATLYRDGGRLYSITLKKADKGQTCSAPFIGMGDS